MDKRNTPLTANTVYCVYKPDGKWYHVWSKASLDKKIEDGIITDKHRVVLTRVQ